jgi:catalase
LQNHRTGPDEERPPLPSVGAALLRLAIIGVVSLLATAAIAHAGGWLHPSKPAPVRVVDGLAQESVLPAGFRLKHVKGPCLADAIESDGQAPRDAKAGMFDRGQMPVAGGFALAGGQPYLPDTPQTARGMALRFMPVGGEDSPLTAESGDEGHDRTAAPLSLLAPTRGGA